MKFEFIRAQKAKFSVSFMCRRLGVSRAGYYAWAQRPESARARADRALGVEVEAIHLETKKRYGAPRVQKALRARGRSVSKKRVARLMRESRLAARAKRRFVRTTDSRHAHPVAENILDRDFLPPEPNATWAGDITYIWTAEGWLYLAVILDLFSRRVVGWATGTTIDRALVLRALTMALSARPAPALYHSDRGSQYASEDYRRALEERGITCSMSRKGNCWDNACVESFFSSLKQELIYLQSWSSRAEVDAALFEYIEVFYNRVRLHSSLGYVSPAAYEQAAASEAKAA